MLKGLLSFLVLLFISSHATANATKGDYRDDWLAGERAISENMPKVISVGFFGAKVGDKSCDVEFPFTVKGDHVPYHNAMQLKCDGYKPIVLKKVDDDILVTFGGKNIWGACPQKTVIARMALGLEPGKCERPMIFTYYNQNSPSKEKPDKSW